MTTAGPSELVLTPAAVRALQAKLPESVAAAVIELLSGSLVEHPQRVGKSLRGGISAAGHTYRVLYRINDDRHEMVVVRIDHRRGACRTD